MRNYIVIFIILFITKSSVKSQDDWDFESNKLYNKIFLDTRAINGHTVNTLNKKEFELRISHRFGDIATSQSYRSLFGLDYSTDIRIGFEYGITEKLMLGFGRCKGSSPFLELWDLFFKRNLYSSSDKKFKTTIDTKLFFTSMQSSFDLTSLNYFSKFSHRLSYHSEILFAYRFHKKLIIQLGPGISYRNLVNNEDDNLLFNISSVVKLHLYKKLSLMIEHFSILSSNEYRISNYKNPLGIGLEINTYAHVFQLNFMNSKGIGEGQFIPYTSSNWKLGEFRFGFTIARKFEL